MGIAAESIDAELFFVPGKSAQGSIHRDNASLGLLSSAIESEIVEFRPLDESLRAEMELPHHVDIVKVDVEGAEETVLRGLAGLTWRYLSLEVSLAGRAGMGLLDALEVANQVWGRRPNVVWAAPSAPTAVTQDVVLHMPAA